MLKETTKSSSKLKATHIFNSTDKRNVIFIYNPTNKSRGRLDFGVGGIIQ